MTEHRGWSRRSGRQRGVQRVGGVAFIAEPCHSHGQNRKTPMNATAARPESGEPEGDACVRRASLPWCPAPATARCGRRHRRRRDWCRARPARRAIIASSSSSVGSLAHVAVLPVTHDRDPIHIAAPTTAMMPMTQIARPSVAGPKPPRPSRRAPSPRADVLDVGDDVALLLRRQLPVGELRHVLRAGDHRGVDLLLVGRGQRRRELAATESAPPRPVKLWQEAQFSRNSSLNRGRCRRRAAMPGRSRRSRRGSPWGRHRWLDVGAERIGLRARRTSPACARPGPRCGHAGIRPEETWK